MTNIARRCNQASWLILAALLPLILQLHLLPALLAGLLIFELIFLTAPRLHRVISSERAVFAAIGVLAVVAILLIGAALAALLAFLRSDAGSFPALFAKLAVILEQARASLPSWLVASLPDSAEAMHDGAMHWLKTHAGEVQGAGKEAGRGVAHVLVGLVIGAMVAMEMERPRAESRPLAEALKERVRRLADAFRRVVFAQVWISAINTALTATFLVIVMPLAGMPLPLTKTMIAVTFVAGLLPVIGNLLSNVLIVVVALSVSLEAGVIALVFLVVVHKLEYFLNARIVGHRIAARPWELLLAMLLMEAAFGIAGVIAAPIFYAYLKDELAAAGLV